MKHLGIKLITAFTLALALFAFSKGCGQFGDNAEICTKKFAVLATPDEVKIFRKALPNGYFSDKLKIECTSHRINNDYISEICSSSYYDTSNTTATVKTINSDGHEVLTTKIDLGSYVSSDMNIATDIHNDLFYISWVSANSEKQIPSSINLRCISLRTGEIIIDTVLYSQRWGIERLSMTWHPKSNSLIFAYNDFSKKDDAYLYFAHCKIDDVQNKDIRIEPKPILLGDKSEKRYPKFLKTNDKVYLYHTTNDRWGFFAHEGKQGVGISEININNDLKNYSMIVDSNTVNNEITVLNDVVFYEHVVGHNNGINQLKKINIKNIFRPFAL